MAVTAGTLTDTLIEIHEFLADLTEIKRLELERDKAAKLARAFNNANQHIKIPMLNSRTAALAILGWTATRIYLPMAKDVMAELDGRGRPAQAPAPAPVQPAAPVGMVPGNVVPVPAEDASLEAWLPSTARN